MADIIAITVSFVALLFSIVTYLASVKHDKKQDTINEYISMQQDLYFIYKYEKSEIEDYVFDKESEEYKALSSCLARIEFFAIGIDKGMYDFDTAYLLAHGYLDLTLRDKLEYLLSMKNEHAINNEAFYIHTKKLLLKMDKKTKKRKK